MVFQLSDLKEGLIANKILKYMEFLMVFQIIFYQQWIKKKKILMKFYLRQKIRYAESNPTADLLMMYHQN